MNSCSPDTESGAMRPKSVTILLIATLVAILQSSSHSNAIATNDDRLGWPRTATTAIGDRVTISQPQVDEWRDGIVNLKCAASIRLRSATAPVIGTLQLRARSTLDRNRRIVSLTNLEVPGLRFPTNEAENAPLQEAVSTTILTATIEIPWDDLTALMTETAFAVPVDDPVMRPTLDVVFRNTPTVLLLFAGAPKLRSISPGSEIQSCINSQWPVFRLGEKWFLCAGGIWWGAAHFDGPWTKSSRLPEALVAESKSPTGCIFIPSTTLPAIDVAPQPKPEEVVVRHFPSELIAIDGAPRFVEVVQDQLHYCANASVPLLRTNMGGFFVLLAGRWWRTEALGEFGWSPVAPTSIPASFSLIPANSPCAEILAHVPGTLADREALQANSLPSLRTIVQGNELRLESWEKAKFGSTEDSTIPWSAMASSPIIKIAEQCYCCDHGAWWTSADPNGPWTPARSLPVELAALDAASPLFPLKFANPSATSSIDPTGVTFDVAARYEGGFVDDGTIVYGTGWPMIGNALEFADELPMIFGANIWWNPWTCQWWSGCETVAKREARLGGLFDEHANTTPIHSTFQPDSSNENLFVGLDGRVYARRDDKWFRSATVGGWTELTEQRSTTRVLNTTLVARGAATDRRRDYLLWRDAQRKLDATSGSTSSGRENSMRASRPRDKGFRSQGAEPRPEN